MDFLKRVYKYISPRFQTVFLDYKVDPIPRFGHGKATHGGLKNILDKERGQYDSLMQIFLENGPALQQWKKQAEENNPNLPAWNNDFLPGLDIFALYGMIAHFKPKRYIEVGSGNSTKVVRKAIQDHTLQTHITSIDPFPRAQIDHLADKVMRIPFEKMENYTAIIDELEENDILFIDNSHRVFTNSDATVFFLEILPFLKKGVIVHIHDIYIPDDYPDFMAQRFYNEQYMLAAFILSNPTRYKTIFPCWYLSQDSEFSDKMLPFFQTTALKDVERHGGSYWLQIQA